jgi:hypothetical protein
MARRIFDDSSKVPYGDHEIGTFSGSSVPPFGGDAAHSAPLGVGRGEYPAPGREAAQACAGRRGIHSEGARS